MNMKISKLLNNLLWGIGLSRSYIVDADGNAIEPGTDEAVGTNNDARLALLDRIADNTEREVADQLADVNDDDTTSPFVAKPAEETTSPEDSTPDEVKEEKIEESAPRLFKVKVNGKELELTEAQLIERAQKVESGDEYLRQAAEVKKKAAESSVPQPSQEELQRLQDEEDRALVRAIQVGTEEEATAALRKLRQQTNAHPSLSTDDVSRVIDQRLEFNSAITRFRTEYKDIDSDPFLRKMALDRDSELLEAGDSRPYWDRYEEIGNGIREWKTKLLAEVQPAVKETLSEKEAKKAAAPKVPTTASAKVKPHVQDDEDGDDNPTAVIQAMAKSRGGPQWMRN